MTSPSPHTEYRGVRMDRNWVDTSQSGLSQSIRPERVQATNLDDVVGFTCRDVVARIARELELSMEAAEELFTDLKKFLYIAAIEEDSLVPTPIIDEAWHRFLLHTQDYTDFCQRFFGGYLHHAPQHEGEARLTHEDLHGTIDAMHRHLGGVPSLNWHYDPSPLLKVA